MRKLAALTAAVWVLAACATHGADPATPRPADTLARIRTLIGTPSCSEDSQCRSLPVGERPCGGPESYLAYSTARSSDAELLALAARYQAERHRANAEAGRVSDCRFIIDPGAVCRSGVCVPGASGAVAR